jgi:hypothetical protein
MNHDRLDQRASELAAEWSLSAEDRDALVAQARWIQAAIDALDDLPLDTVEPPIIYQVLPE